MTEDSAAAFFDLDRTLMAGSSGVHFGRAAYRAGLVSRWQMASWALDHLRFRLRGATDEQTEELVEQIKELLGGVPERRLRWLVPEMLAGVLPRIYPQMIDEVRSHQDAGRPTFIVSAAGDGIVQLLATILDMEGGIGTRYRIDEQGRFSGELDGGLVYGPGKVAPIERYAAEHAIDLKTSWAYSDSVSDLPMLELVGNPVVVNPDRDLAMIAKQRGWRVMRFEKLGRRLAVGATVLAAGALGGSGTWLAARRRPRRASLLR